MRLSNKVILTLSAIWVIFLAISFTGTYLYLMKSIYKLENKEINNDISRVYQAIDQKIYAIGNYALDWSHWNDAYDYIEGTNPQFVPNNLDLGALQTTKMNFIFYLNKQGKILIGIAIDIQQKKMIPFAKGLDKYIYPGSRLETHEKFNKNVRGLVLTDSGIALIASAGVSNTLITKPMNGTFIAGSFFSKDILANISDTTHFNLMLYTPKNLTTNDLKNIYTQAIKEDDRKIILSNDNMAYAYLVLRDINHDPIGMIRIDIHRSIYQTGFETISYYLGIYLISGFILGIVILYLLRVLVLNRIEQLHNQIGDIISEQDYKLRINLKGKDELSLLANQFNDLMQTIQDSHEQLEKQVKELSESEKRLARTNDQLIVEINERKQAEEKVNVLHEKLIMAARRAGMADIASGILHNVGNILNSVTTTITLAREDTLKSRAIKLQEVVAILQKNKENLVDYLLKDAKGQKIINYLELLASEWGNENSHMLNEIAGLDKNINHIKDVIAMQQSLSTIVSLNEETNLEVLIEDAIILNLNLYKDKSIEIVRDYQFTGKIVIDKVKLLHVLVNLIKNSMDSLLESNIEPKQVIIRTKSKDSNYFVIEIEDAGVGILPENLIKIFSYGFTTKKNGHGFGLHTSATFVKEMKGYLSAESNGYNQGAKFIIILPIEPLTNKNVDNPEINLSEEQSG